MVKFTVRHNITVVLVWPGPERGCMRMASRRHDIHVCCKLVGLVLLFVFPCSSPQVLRTMVSLVLPGEGIFESFFARHGDI